MKFVKNSIDKEWHAYEDSNRVKSLCGGASQAFFFQIQDERPSEGLCEKCSKIIGEVDTKKA